MVTAEDIAEFKRAFQVSAETVNTSIRWDPPTGKLKAFKTQTSMAGVVSALEDLEDDLTIDNIEAVFDQIRLLQQTKDDKVRKYIDALRELVDSLKEVRTELREAERQAEIIEKRRVMLEQERDELTRIPEARRELVAGKEEWKPGQVAVTDLTRFPQCIAPGAGGELSTVASEDYVTVEGDTTIYYPPTTLPPKDAGDFLSTWEKRQAAMEEGKICASECSNFSYDAIAECLLDDDIRANYDVLQAGTMGQQHNIAILVPKGQGAGYAGGDTPLPEGSLIVDPWARAMGQPADKALFATPEDFAYKDSLYPTVINFNSTKPAGSPFAPKSTEDMVKSFKENRAMKRFFNQISPHIELNEHFIGSTDAPSSQLSGIVIDALGLDGEDEEVTVRRVEMDRGAGLLEITYQVGDAEAVTIDKSEFLRRQ